MGRQRTPRPASKPQPKKAEAPTIDHAEYAMQVSMAQQNRPIEGKCSECGAKCAACAS